eukprot:357281-Chlamydomonas_euryale.AAC.27
MLHPCRLTAAAGVSGLHSTDGAKDAIASDDGDIESNKQHRSSKHRCAPFGTTVAPHNALLR